MNLCKYSNIFGEVGTGLHKHRIFGLATIDVVFTIIFGVMIGFLLNINIGKSTFMLFILGIIMHRIFCVRTALDELLFNTL